MTKTLIAALALTGAAAFPALAQQQDTPPPVGEQQQQAQQTMPGGTSGQGTSGQGSSSQGMAGQTMSPEEMQSRIASQQQVRDALEQSGFEEVNLLDAAYLVAAKAPSGETVMMVVNPSGLMQTMMQGGATGSVGQGGSGMPGGSGMQGGSGTPGGSGSGSGASDMLPSNQGGQTDQ